MARFNQTDRDNFINIINSLNYEIKPIKEKKLHEDCFYLDQYPEGDQSNNPFMNLSHLELMEKELEISFKYPDIFKDFDIEKLKNEINILKDKCSDMQGPFIQLSVERFKSEKFDEGEYLNHLKKNIPFDNKEEQKILKCYNCMKETNMVGVECYWFCDECLDK